MRRENTMQTWVMAILVCTTATAGTISTRAEEPPANGPIAGPVVSIVRQDGGAGIHFKGTLQSTTNLTGPWLDVPGASTPHLPGTTSLQAFYRARTPDSIFSSASLVTFTLTGPFQQHFKLAYAGLPDGIFPPVRLKPYFDGSLQMTGFAFPISLRVRGNSSLQECPFPKLKFKISRDERGTTPFFDAREVKIGTHCAEGGRGNIGRLREQIATFREALAYETMDLLGFTSPRVRRAHIEYHDTTPTNLTEFAGWQLSRDALIFDDIEVVAERMGGRAFEDEELPALTVADFDAQLLTDLQFLHALFGNWDYGLFIDGQGLWNTDVIEQTSGELVPVAGDFDLASWVTGIVRFMGPRDYRPELPDVERQAQYELEQIQGRVSTSRFTAAKDRFTAKRSEIETQITIAQLDESGRSNCLRHVTAFYDAVNAVSR